MKIEDSIFFVIINEVFENSDLKIPPAKRRFCCSYCSTKVVEMSLMHVVFFDFFKLAIR